MIIRSKKLFDRQYVKLPQKIQRKAQERIELFSINPIDPILNNHPLKGKLKGLRAFSITGDVRVIFEELDNYIVVYFIAIGTHNQVYD